MRERQVEKVVVGESDDFIRDLTMELVMSRLRGLERIEGLMSVREFMVIRDFISVKQVFGGVRMFRVVLEEVTA